GPLRAPPRSPPSAMRPMPPEPQTSSNTWLDRLLSHNVRRRSSRCRGRLRLGRAAILGITFAAIGSIAGCSTERPWLNQPLTLERSGIDVKTIANRDPSALVVVTISGGGARAAAFGFGVLKELRATPCCWNDRDSNLLDAVDL